MPQVRPNVVLLAHTPDPENLVALAAKICYTKANLADLKEKIEAKDQQKFIKELAEVGHESTFEHVSFTFGIEGISRACSHQIVRHRIASYSQQSQRYNSFVGDEVFDYVVPPTVKDPAKFHVLMKGLQDHYNAITKELKDAGVEKSKIAQDARFLLPNAAATRLIWTMNVRTLRHVFKLRTCNRAQWEIRFIVQKMWEICRGIAPNLFAGSGPSCVESGKCPEGDRACGEMKEMLERYGR